MLKVCLWGSRALDILSVPLILLGMGNGMVDIPLLVTAHASCSRRSDVAIATGLMMAAKGLAVQTGRAVCDALIGYYAPLESLPAVSAVTAADQVQLDWGLLIMTSIVVQAVNFAAATVLLPNVRFPCRLRRKQELTFFAIEKYDLPSMQQHVTGVVFGTPDDAPAPRDGPAESAASTWVGDLDGSRC
jgi:hypothetical protein